jgi:hypothetical protein
VASSSSTSIGREIRAPAEKDKEMNLIMLQGKIVNLDNVTVADKYNPGESPGYPLHHFRFSQYTIWLEFNISISAGTNLFGRETFDSAVTHFEYATKEARDRDWQQLCDLVKRR